VTDSVGNPAGEGEALAGIPVTVWLALAAIAAAGIYVAVLKLGPPSHNRAAEAASLVT
jgi:hypothetical protein